MLAGNLFLLFAVLTVWGPFHKSFTGFVKVLPSDIFRRHRLGVLTSATQGLGFRVWGLGFRAQGLGFRASGLGTWATAECQGLQDCIPWYLHLWDLARSNLKLRP